MTARLPCPISWCDWTHRPLAKPAADDVYGPLLTDADVIAAHVATHPRDERAGRMPSRARVEAGRIAVPAVPGILKYATEGK